MNSFLAGGAPCRLILTTIMTNRKNCVRLKSGCLPLLLRQRNKPGWKWGSIMRKILRGCRTARKTESVCRVNTTDAFGFHYIVCTEKLTILLSCTITGLWSALSRRCQKRLAHHCENQIGDQRPKAYIREKMIGHVDAVITIDQHEDTGDDSFDISSWCFSSVWLHCCD